jgi:arylsulfatase A-like enzyme
LNPLAVMLAMSKPRFRRQIRTSGFFHAAQRESREFVERFARTTIPADRELLHTVIERMRSHRAANRRFFITANLYDIHAPYPPRDAAIFRSWADPRNWEENVVMPVVLPRLGSHAYLAEGFAIRERHRRLLLGRYVDAIRLLDAKIGAFLDALAATGLRDDLLLVVTSDHGEAFGEHSLYLHDASVYDVHLHVPLWVTHPRLTPHTVHEPVTTRHLFHLLQAMALGDSTDGTILDAGWRAENPIALAEHHYYPHAPWIAARHRQNLRAAIAGPLKAIRRDGTPIVDVFDLRNDREEGAPEAMTVAGYLERCRAMGYGDLGLRTIVGHLEPGSSSGASRTVDALMSP